MNPFTFTFPGGRLIDNFETLGAVATKTWTVPAGKRWVIIGGAFERDTSATLILQLTNAADKVIDSTPLVTAGTTMQYFSDMAYVVPWIADAGMKIVLTWGAGQTSNEITLLVLEIDL